MYRKNLHCDVSRVVRVRSRVLRVRMKRTCTYAFETLQTKCKGEKGAGGDVGPVVQRLLAMCLELSCAQLHEKNQYQLN